MHAGFASLRSALPMNLRGHFPDFRVWSRAQGDIDRITDIWRDCLTTYGGPYLFGARRTLADAMYAPVCTRFCTYGVALDEACAGYRDTILAMPEMREWHEAALQEPEEIDELDARIRTLRDQGRTIVLIEHHMELVMGVCDRVAVLNFGRKIAEGTPRQVQDDAQVRAAYLGADDADELLSAALAA